MQVGLVAILLFGVSPFIPVAPGLIATANGCQLDKGTQQPCASSDTISAACSTPCACWAATVSVLSLLLSCSCPPGHRYGCLFHLAFISGHSFLF